MPTRRGGPGLWLLAATFLAWGVLYIVRTSVVVDGERIFVLWDDAMISMRYAANLAQGAGLVWNAGEAPVQGFSNPAVTLGMAALHLLPIADTWISLWVQLANLAGLAAIPFLLHRIAGMAFPTDRGVATLAAVSVGLCAPLAIWGLQGSDTTAVCLWLLLALVGYGGAPVRRPGGLFALLALGALIRLDTLIFGAVFVAASLAEGRRPRTLLLAGASYAGVLGGFLLLSFAYYGDPLPNTFYLKATGMPVLHMLEWGAVRLILFWSTAVPALLLAIFAVARYWREPLVPLCAGLVAVAFAYDVRVGSDWAAEYGSRFTTPVLPLLSLLACAGGRALWADHAPERLRGLRGAGTAVSLATLLACAFAAPRLARVEWFDPRAPTLYRAENTRNARLGLYLREHTAPETRLAVHWGGLLPYLSRRPAIDVYGKSDRHIAKLEVTRFVPGHSKRDWRYVLVERKPDIVPIASGPLDRTPYFVENFRHVESGGVEFFVHRDSLFRVHDPRAVVRRYRPRSQARAGSRE